MEDALIAHLVRADVLSAICSLLRSDQPEILVSVLRVIANLALASDSVSARLCNASTVPLLIDLCHSPHMMVREGIALSRGRAYASYKQLLTT